MPGRVDGIALGSIAAGAIAGYAGIKGWSIPQTVQDLVQGKNPAGQPQAHPITGTSPPAAGAGDAGGGPVLRGSSGTAWSSALLNALGAPQTPANINSINGWQAREGGGGQNNPLNTTQPAPGSTSFNSVGVQNYPTVAEGITATVETLNNGRYGDILLLLHSGQGLCGMTLAGLSTWSGGGYASVC